MEEVPLDLLIDQYVLLVPVVWILLQAVALWKLEGGWRIAAWIPLIAMGVALSVAVLGGLAGSNLAPIWVVFTLPVVLFWMVVLWIVRGVLWVFHL